MDKMMVVTAAGHGDHYVLGVADDGPGVDALIDADAAAGAHPSDGWVVWRQDDDGAWAELVSTSYQYDHEQGRYRHWGWSKKQRELLGLETT